MAGFFGLFDYSKPGKGVDKEGPQKKRFFYFFELYFRKFWKLITLNLIYVLFCIPIVTIGPATAAMQKVLRDFTNEKGVFLWSDFLDAFKKNFKQSFVVGLLDIVIGAVLVFCAYFYYQNAAENKMFLVPLGLAACALFIFTMMNYYIYLMIVTLDMKLLPMLKNAFYLSILGIKTNLCTFFFIAVLSVAMLFGWLSTVLGMLIVTLLLLIIYFTTSSFIVVFNSYPKIEKFIIEPYYEKTGERRPDVYYGEEDEFEDSVFEDIGTREKPAALAPAKHGKTIK